MCFLNMCHVKIFQQSEVHMLNPKMKYLLFLSILSYQIISLYFLV